MTLNDQAAHEERQGVVVAAVASHMALRFHDHTKYNARDAFLARTASPARRHLLALPLSLGVLCVCSALWLMFLRPLTVTSNQVALDSDLNFEVGSQAAKLLFSDGSEASLQPGVVGKVTRLDRRGADFRLSKGHVEIKVAKRPGARWSIFAGPYKVRVTGTRFQVGWQSELSRFTIRMWEGHVLVEGPDLPGARALHAGDSLDLGAPVSPADVPVRTNAATKTKALSLQLPTNLPAKAPAAAPQKKPIPRRDTQAWSSLVARGQYEAVLAAAKREGLKSVLSSSSLEQLAALADAGRFGKDAHIAEQALLAQRRQYPQSERALMAAYLLGRLAEDAGQPKEAVAWYDQYLGAGKSLALAEESLGRKMLALERAGMPAAALQVARAYKTKYPSGSFLRAASRIEAAQSLK